MKRGKRFASGILAVGTAFSAIPVAQMVQIVDVRAENLGGLTGTGTTEVDGSVIKHYGETSLKVDPSFFVASKDVFEAFEVTHSQDPNVQFNGENLNNNGVVTLSGFNGQLVVFKVDEVTRIMNSERFEVQNIKPIVEITIGVDSKFNPLDDGTYLTSTGGKLPVRVTVSSENDVSIKDTIVSFWVNGVYTEKSFNKGTHTTELDLPEATNNLYTIEYEVTDATGSVIASTKGIGENYTIFKEEPNTPTISVSGDEVSYDILEKKQNIGKVGISYLKGDTFSGNFVEKGGVLMPDGGVLLEIKDFTPKSSYSGKSDLSSISDGGKYLIFVSNSSLIDNKASIAQVSYYKDITAPVIDATVIGEGFEVNGKYWFRETPKVNYAISDDAEVAERSVVFVEEGFTEENQVSTLEENNGTFEIENQSKRGSYKIKAVDTSGKTSYKELGSFTPFGIDANKPIIKEITLNEVYNGYFKKGTQVKIPVNVSDYESGVKLVKVFRGTTEIVKDADGSYIATLDSSSETIKIEAEDYVGNKETVSVTLKADETAPTITTPTDFTYEVVDGVLYTNKPIPYKMNAEDLESGVKGYSVGGVFYGNNTESTISSSTETLPNVLVMDNVGNELEIPFWQLVGVKEFSKIVVDNSSPQATFDKSSTVDGYFKDTNQVSLMFSLTSKRGYVTVTNSEGETLISYRGVNDGEILLIPVKDGNNNLTVSITDVAWNTNVINETIRVDNTDPKVKGIVTGYYNLKDNIVYAKDKLKFDFETADSESGISKVVLIQEGIETPITNNSVTISKNAESYKLKVTDKVGHTVEKNLDEFLSAQGVKKWVFDSEAPIIKTNFDAPISTHNGEKIYNEDFLVKATVVENEDTFESFELFDNGVSKGQLNRSTQNYKITDEGKHQLRLVAKDKSGNESSSEYTFILDKSAPTGIKATVNSEVRSEKQGVFSKTPINVTLNATDNVVGVKGYWINGVFQESNVLTLNNGSYKIQVEDFAGNKTQEVSLNTLIGWESNNIFIDNKTPIIKVNKHGGKWFNSGVSNEVLISDDLGIAYYEVEINGIKVVNKTLEGFNKSVKEVVKSSSVEMLDSGRYDVVIRVKDLSGNSQELSDYYFIDNTKPVVTNFEFMTDGYLEGDKLNGSNELGFFFKDGAIIRIHAKDEGASSGLSKMLVKVGNSAEREYKIENGYAEVLIPVNFKGWISAKAVDSVNNTSESVTPSGVVTEDANFSISNNFIDLLLPSTPFKDVKGNALYNHDIEIGVEGRNKFVGLRSLKVNDSEEVYDIRGNSNEVFESTLTTENNLVTYAKGKYQVSGNSNGIALKGVLTDRSGHSKTVNKVISIDKDAPQVSISYSSSKENGVFNQSRTATITIDERNFSPSKVTISGKTGTMSNWSYQSGVWVAQMFFDSDGDYGFSVEVEDLAGNKSPVINSENFTIDKTAPIINVNFDNNNVSNGKYYSLSRTATITVNEKNFSSSLISVEGGSVSGWSSSGDMHTATVTFSSDGVYTLKVSGSDLGGNVGNGFDSGEFVIDTTKPTLSISGITNGSSYFKDFGFMVNYSDTNLDSNNTIVTLTGREKGNINIGSLDGLIEYFNNDIDSKMDDLYTLKTLVSDLAGNKVEEVITFSVNRGGSVFSFLNEDYNGKYLKEVNNLVIQEVTVDELDEGTILILLGDKTLSVPNDKVKVTKSGGTDSKWVYTYEIDKSLFSEDGVYRVQLLTKTKTGKENSSLSQEYVFVVDKTPPKVVVGGVEANSSYKDEMRKVSINVEDLSGVDNLKFFVNDEEMKVYWENGIAYVDLKESPNSQNIKIGVIDKAGNVEVIVVDNVFINSSWLLQLIRTIWFKLGIGVLVALIGWVFFILFKNKKKQEEEEKSLEEMISTTSSATGSSETENTIPLGGDDLDDRG